MVNYFGLDTCHRLPSLSKKHGRLDVHVKMGVTPICTPNCQSFATPYRVHNNWVLIHCPPFLA
jgi:hypothetical protein